MSVYVPGSVGNYKGYNLPFAARGKKGSNQQTLYPQWKKGGKLIQLDVRIVNSTPADLNIELLNNWRSQFKLYSPNNAPNNYYPLGVDDNAGQPGSVATYTNPAVTVATTVTHGYVTGIFKSALNTFVSQATPPVPTGNTKNICYFDIYGNAIYQPGLDQSGTQVTGNVIISCQQMPYFQLFEYAGEKKFIYDAIKFTYNPEVQTAQMGETVYHKYFSSTGIATNTENYTPSTFYNESNFQNNVVTVPVDKINTPQWGIWTNIKGVTQATNTQVTASLFLWVDAGDLQTSSAPEGY